MSVPPVSESTIGRQLLRAASEAATVEAVVDGAVRWTYAELGERVIEAAGAFVASGLQRGQRVALWAPNVRQWIVSALGASLAGGVLVPLNTRYKGFEAADIINRSATTMLFGVNGFLGNDYPAMLDTSGEPLNGLDQRVVLLGDPSPGWSTFDEFLARSTETARDEAVARAMSQPDSDLSDIIFTSGTTGRPKGVMCSHAQTMRVFTTWSATVGLARADRYLVVNPFFHTFGYKAGILASLIRGATIVPEPVFDVDTVMATIARERITMLPGPPTIYLGLLNHPQRDRYDLSSLRTAVTGAAAVPVEMIRRMREEMTFTTILTAYGLTESTGTISMCQAGDAPEIISMTSGRAIDGVEMRVVDDDNQPVPVGSPGEIVCRGYNVMQGYLDDPEATAATIDGDGWLHTGDVGVLDDHGNVAITDRKKDMFIVGGQNAYPAEIEGLLLRHPGIAQVAVIGVPDERLGEVGHAFAIARPGMTLDPAEVVAWARTNMANYKAPRQVTVVDALPTNPSGKVLKYELRHRATNTPGGSSR